MEDILKGSDKIQKYSKGKSYNEFIEDELLVDGVIRNLVIIGEAVKNIPTSFRKRYPFIEWRKVAGLREVYHPIWQIKRLLVFGSRAKGEVAKESDLDVIALASERTPKIEKRLLSLAG